MRDNGLEQEGVTKFDLRFTPTAPLPPEWLAGLNEWRSILFQRHLIGQDRTRYGGIGYGNVSRRAPEGQRGLFVVSGTQTGGHAVLTAADYALVTDAGVAANRLDAEGPIAPSSESLTHAMIYALSSRIQYVFHVHSPQIWRAAADLGIPATPPDVAYGTPAMAEAVARLYRDGLPDKGLFAMGGHTDGVVAFAETADQAGQALLTALEQARALPLSRTGRV